MLRAVHEALCGTRRNRILLGLAATIGPLLVVLMLLEMSYREQEARELSLMVTGSLPSSTTVGAPRSQLNPDYPRSTPLSGPIVPFAPPTPVVAAAPPPPAEPTRELTQRAVVSRESVPLPRSRPNRF
jgi:hypothetical protein